jgi:GntR family transcriptional regulator
MVHFPKYEQVRRKLAGWIGADFGNGDLLPTHRKIAERFGVSLITVKRATDELAREGWIESRRGVGTVVKAKGGRGVPTGVSSWTDSIAELGGVPSTAWASVKTKVAPANVARLLGLGSRASVLEIRRLRCSDGLPVCVMTNFLPAVLVPGLQHTGLLRESLYQDLAERFKLEASTARESVTARETRPAEQQQLGADSRVVLEITRVTRLENGTPMEWARVVARADRYSYHVQLFDRNTCN